MSYFRSSLTVADFSSIIREASSRVPLVSIFLASFRRCPIQDKRRKAIQQLLLFTHSGTGAADVSRTHPAVGVDAAAHSNNEASNYKITFLHSFWGRTRRGDIQAHVTVREGAVWFKFRTNPALQMCVDSAVAQRLPARPPQYNFQNKTLREESSTIPSGSHYLAKSCCLVGRLECNGYKTKLRNSEENMKQVFLRPRLHLLAAHRFLSHEAALNNLNTDYRLYALYVRAKPIKQSKNNKVKYYLLTSVLVST